MSQATAPEFGISKNVKRIGRTDLAGGGQVVVEDGYAFVGHMDPPHGTTILDVRDPKHPKTVAQIEIPQGVHSHKVQVSGDIMLVNLERYRSKEKQPTGLKIYDISRREKPKEIAFFQTNGGVHRFTFDGTYAYISAHIEGYIGRIVMIVDCKDPTRPQEVGRWWMPGQWTGGGETPAWSGRHHRCHHPIRSGNRLYVSYWHGGFVILDIEDMGKPRFVSGLDWSPPYITPTHTALPLPFPLHGRRIMLAADEDVAKTAPGPPSFLWLVDITDERHPVPISTFQVPGVNGDPQPEFTGCHQPCERVTGPEIPVAWFAHGLRIVDVANPHAPREVAHFLPDPPAGHARVSSNDVEVDGRGLFFVIDRGRGLHILERT